MLEFNITCKKCNRSLNTNKGFQINDTIKKSVLLISSKAPAKFVHFRTHSSSRVKCVNRQYYENITFITCSAVLFRYKPSFASIDANFRPVLPFEMTILKPVVCKMDIRPDKT